MELRGDLTIETENGEVVDSLDIHINDVMRIIDALPVDQLKSTHCLQYIDNWGDTIFNWLQIEKLVLELEGLTSICSDSAERANLAQVIDILSRCKDSVHLYIKFHGD